MFSVDLKPAPNNKDIFHVKYCHELMGSVTSLTRVCYVNYIMTTCIRIGYWIYSLSSLQLKQVAITKNTLALVASRIPLTELH
jgi:hypothetical protein